MSLYSAIFGKKTETKSSGSDRTASGPVTLKQAKFNFNDVLRDVANILSEEAQKRGNDIIYKVDKTVPSKLIGDRYKLTAALTELLGNAVRYGKENGDVTVRFYRNEANEEAIELHTEVRNEGAGFDAEELNDKIRPMLESDEPASTFGLKGVGLENARGIVRAMQGNITIESDPGAGCQTAFFVLLGASNLKEKRHYRLPSVDGVGRRSLIVDDDDESAGALKGMLEYFRHEVTIVDMTSPKAAAQYDLVLVAEMLWNDAEMTQLAHSEIASKPFLVIIENMMNHVHQDASALSASDWLLYKPFTQQFVFEMLSALYPGKAEEEAETSPENSESATPQVSAEEATLAGAVESFLRGGMMPRLTGESETCFCDKNTHHYFVASAGLNAFGNDDSALADALQSFVLQYGKSDRAVYGMLEKKQFKEAMEQCAKIKTLAHRLGMFKLGCFSYLLETAIRSKSSAEAMKLIRAFTTELSQSVNAVNQFAEQVRQKHRG